MKNELVAKASRSLHKVGFKIKKHSPEILVVAGVVGIVASTVMACRATTKVSEIVDDTKNIIDTIHDALENEKCTAEGEVYTQEDANKDLAIVYTQAGWNLTKLYGPAVVIGVASIACMIGSNRILRKRNVALAAAFATVDKSFKEYRGRLIERFGEGLDRELRFNIKAKEFEETVIDENGNETVVTRTVEVIDPNVTHSIYSVVFCEGNLGWTKNPELNKLFLIQQQNHANDMLRMKGLVTLNDIYDMLGVPRTAYGQYAGWVYDEEYDGDDFIDFGIFDTNNPKACDFVNGWERSIILDFNCHENILPYM